MTFKDSVNTCFRKWRDPSGRAARSEFWWFWLFTVLISLLVGFLEDVLGFATWSSNPQHPFYGMSEGPLSFGLMWVLLLPMINVSIRRIHDHNASGWWVLGPYSSYLALPFLGGFLQEVEAMTINGRPSDLLIRWLIGVGIWGLVGLIFTIFMLLRGTRGGNRFGPDPLAPPNDAEIFA